MSEWIVYLKKQTVNGSLCAVKLSLTYVGILIKNNTTGNLFLQTEGHA
jgi:hypothetical protein